jgi:serine/threonine-protein kinase
MGPLSTAPVASAFRLRNHRRPAPPSTGGQLAAVPPPTLRQGDIIGGRYQVEEFVGEGGMGIVVAARHLELGHRVAIKYLRPEACRRPDIVARFRWEARAGLQIRSEHVVRVTDAGILGDGTPYLVMELLDGIDLGTLLKQRRGPLEVGEALDYVLQACEAIVEAHAMGIVHRDLKPENLFLTRRADGTPLVKVIDFGISSGVDLAVATGDLGQPSVTVEIMGSPAYMAPEQVRNFETVDARADVWSLGAILYELLTGSLIHDEKSVGPLLTRICHCPVRSARGRRADLPEELDGVILRCLERDPSRRVQNVAELARALIPFAAERSKASIARIVGAQAAVLSQ